jgi:glycosyltransferase involved in cell wall biosynthesis
MEDISIIVPVYNHERTVAETLDSILIQDMPYSSGIYCFDDCSSDGSAQVLEEYRARFPDRIRVFRTPKNLGSGRAVQYFYRFSLPGRYWCMLEGDDYWTHPGKLKMQIDFLEQQPEFVGCSCNTTIIDETTGQQSLIAPSRQEWNLLDMLVLNSRYLFYVHTSAIVWRNIHKATGFHLPPLFEKHGTGDTMLLHMMLMDGGLMKNIPESMSCYRVTGTGRWSKLSAAEQRATNEGLKTRIRRVTPRKIRLVVWLNRVLLVLQRILPARLFAFVHRMARFLAKPVNAGF